MRANGDRLRVDTDRGTWSAAAVVNATGTWSRPYVPYYPGQDLFAGRELHTMSYQDPDEFAG